MSADIVDDLHAAEVVDDLHAAEDTIGQLRSALVLALALLPEATRPITPVRVSMAEVAVHTYCRPSCGAYGPRSECESEDPDLCGCPCHP